MAVWVMVRRTLGEHMFSALPPIAAGSERPADFLAALDASSVKPMWREIGAFLSKCPPGTIQAAPCCRT